MSQPKFKVGDWVAYTNDYGVKWGTKRITGIDDPNDWPASPEPRYFFEPTDTPWYPVREGNLEPAEPPPEHW